MKPPCLIVGDSHVDCVKDALAHGGGAALDASAFRLAKMKNGRPVGELSLEEATSRIAALGPDAIVACAIGGNQHQAMGLIQHPRRFDIAMPGEPFSPPPDIEVVPFHAIRAVFETGLRQGDFAKICAVRKAAHCAVVQLAPPPPKADEGHILRSIESYFVNRGISEHGVTNASLRLKLWRVQIDVMEALCREAGVTLLRNPPGTRTEEGYLAPAFYAQDATHANRAYGEQVLMQIESHLAASGSADGPEGRVRKG